jgi:hypothetical protein
MVRVKLNDGTEVLYDWSFEEMEQAFQYALSHGHPLKVNGTNGKTWAVNPNQISYFEAIDPASVEVEENGDRSQAADPFAAPA